LCYRIEDIEDEDEFYKQCRWLDKLVDELAKGQNGKNFNEGKNKYYTIIKESLPDDDNIDLFDLIKLPHLHQNWK